MSETDSEAAFEDAPHTPEFDADTDRTPVYRPSRVDKAERSLRNARRGAADTARSLRATGRNARRVGSEVARAASLLAAEASDRAEAELSDVSARWRAVAGVVMLAANTAVAGVESTLIVLLAAFVFHTLRE